MNYLNMLKQIIRKSKAKSQEALIQTLIPYICTWCSHYKIISQKKVLNLCDHILFQTLWKWACRKHPNKSRNWVKEKYYCSSNSNKTWNFCTFNYNQKSKTCLPKHETTRITRHLKIWQHTSFYNENWKYFLKRVFNMQNLVS